MTRSLKFINQLVANADPTNYDSVSYNKFFKNLTDISNMVMDEVNAQSAKDKVMLNEILKLENSPIKDNLLKLINQ